MYLYQISVIILYNIISIIISMISSLREVCFKVDRVTYAKINKRVNALKQ